MEIRLFNPSVILDIVDKNIAFSISLAVLNNITSGHKYMSVVPISKGNVGVALIWLTHFLYYFIATANIGVLGPTKGKHLSMSLFELVAIEGIINLNSDGIFEIEVPVVRISFFIWNLNYICTFEMSLKHPLLNAWVCEE